GWTNPPTGEVAVTAGTASKPIPLTPPRFGLNVLYVSARDKAGKKSGVTEYRFLVSGPSAALGHWPLDSLRDHGLKDSVTGASLTGDAVQWRDDLRYIGARSLDLAGGAVSGPVANLEPRKA